LTKDTWSKPARMVQRKAMRMRRREILLLLAGQESQGLAGHSILDEPLARPARTGIWVSIPPGPCPENSTVQDD